MLKTYQFKTHCKDDSHTPITANIVLLGLMIKQRSYVCISGTLNSSIPYHTIRVHYCKRNHIQIQLH